MKVRQIGPTFLVPGKTVIFLAVKSAVPFFLDVGHIENEESVKPILAMPGFGKIPLHP